MPGSWPAHVFPKLTDKTCKVTSKATRQYNCIAWAFGRTDRKMWPDPYGIGYWPPDVQREATVEAFTAAYGTLGYVACANDSLELGFEKIAIYASVEADGSLGPTHAALQLYDGTWTSKLGDFEDITHSDLRSLSPTYGKPVQFLRRPRK